MSKILSLLCFDVLTLCDKQKYYVVMNTNAPNIIIVPFCNQTPMFLTKAFDDALLRFEKTKAFVVLPFFVHSPYRRLFNALVLKNGKIDQIFGESFSSKKAKFCVDGIWVCVLLHNRLYSIEEPKNADETGLFVAIDDEDCLENRDYLFNRFCKKLLFVGKNGKIFVGKCFLKSKNSKKNVKIVIQKQKKLL